VTAFQSALELCTREQLPQYWAAAQYNLAIALGYQAARIDGEKRVELADLHLYGLRRLEEIEMQKLRIWDVDDPRAVIVRLLPVQRATRPAVSMLISSAPTALRAHAALSSFPPVHGVDSSNPSSEVGQVRR
jgi:hypothetical protein